MRRARPADYVFAAAIFVALTLVVAVFGGWVLRQNARIDGLQTNLLRLEGAVQNLNTRPSKLEVKVYPQNWKQVSLPKMAGVGPE